MTMHWDGIYEVMQLRRQADPDMFRRMIEVRDRYENDIVIPLPDVDGKPSMPVTAPALIAEGIDGLAMRAASTRPTISTPSMKQTKTSRKRAEERRHAWYGRWYESGLTDVLMGRAYRHWFGYGATTLGAFPRLGVDEEPGARIELVNPLTCYPEPRSNDDHRSPLNVGMVFGRSREWLTKRYPELVRPIFSKWDSITDRDTLWDVVEWWDCEQRVIGLLGPRDNYSGSWQGGGDNFFATQFGGQLLQAAPNRAERVPIVAPRRLTLSRIEGQVAKMVPQQDLLGRLYALEYKAAEKAVFPDMVVLGENGRQPELVAGRWVDGREGEVNLVLNSRGVDVLRSEQSVGANIATDRLERAARISGRVSPQHHGESTGASLRTGRALDAAASFAIDPDIQEAHGVFGRNLSELNKCIAAVEKGYFGGKKLWVFSGWSGEGDMVEYDPRDIYETDVNVASYNFAGTDISAMTVAVAQLNGSGLMSKASARAKHPFIDDPEGEARIDLDEQLQAALISGLQQRASMGEIPEQDLATIVRHVSNGDTLYDAVEKAQQDAQERQAAQAPEPEQPGQMAPEQMPGMANPGAGAEMQPPENAEARIQSAQGGDLNRLNQLLYHVRNTQPPGA